MKKNGNNMPVAPPTAAALPPGLSYCGPWREARDTSLLSDLSYPDGQGGRCVAQAIFDAMLALIATASRLIVLDLFLFNPYQGRHPEHTRALSGELTDALLARKQACPQLEIILITDPVNTFYGALPCAQFSALERAGVRVVETVLDRLPDSNRFYSPCWRLLIRPFGTGRGGCLPSPLGPGRVSLRSVARMLNFKANHRKVLVADSPGGWRGMVSSANAHDASSAHDNMAVLFGGAAVADLLESELAVLDFCEQPRPQVTPLQILTEQYKPDTPAEKTAGGDERAVCRVLTEGQIRRALLSVIETSRAGDCLDLLLFYLSEREIIAALLAAHERGVHVRVLLDPNKDAFGHNKNGIPNRPVAQELHYAGIAVRWCDTHGEQCHVKTLLRHRQGSASVLLTGSANFTRRNLCDLNLETDLQLEGPPEHGVIRDAVAYFETFWGNRGGRRLSVDYAVYADHSRIKRWLYRAMEASGFCTF
ncbi:phospholipase D-like domain-containing protein [Granulosicoccaceae sp. 1_MG-2023]|nr:phospholipase D-like domain-containing protein [Granulosicoccaceae sp. 1_MG-2023]